MNQQNQPTRLEIDQARQIIGHHTVAAYRDRAEALAWRTLGVVTGLADLDDPARAIRLIRAALRAERELSAVGTPAYDDIMAEPTADRPCPVCGNYPTACTCRIGDGSPRANRCQCGAASGGNWPCSCGPAEKEEREQAPLMYDDTVWPEGGVDTLEEAFALEMRAQGMIP